MWNPWASAAEARMRAARADERAEFLERQLDRAQRAFDESRDSEVRTLKILANMGCQQAFGFIPFREAESVPVKQESEIRELESMMRSAPDARTAAFLNFRDAELRNFPNAAEAVPDETVDD